MLGEITPVELILIPLTFLVSIFIFILCMHFLYFRLRVDYNTPRNLTMAQANQKSTLRAYFCAIMQTFYKSKGIFNPSDTEEMQAPDPKMLEKYPGLQAVFYPCPSEKLVVVDCMFYHDKFKLYKKSIGFSGEEGHIPPVFPSAYFNKSLIAAGCAEFSKIRILGAIHMKQEITVHKDLSPMKDTFKMTMFCEFYRQTDGGLECDIKQGVMDKDDTLLWEGKVTGFSPRFEAKKGARRRPVQPPAPDVYKKEIIQTYRSTGMEFARATVDWQPQHLNKWTAKLVGFDAPIAHGLWTMAVAVDRIMKNEKCFRNVYPLHIEVSFKRPFVLGQQGLLLYDKPEGENNLVKFKVIRATCFSPILEGSIYTGEKKV